MSNENQVEGDKAGARRFNKAQREFIESEEGLKAFEKDHSIETDTKKDYQATLRKAARRARS